MLKLKNHKICKINYSYLIFLPMMWLEYHNLHRGDVLSLEITDDEDGRALIIRPAKNDRT